MNINPKMRRRLLILGLLSLVITEAMRSLYRPWIYSHGYADFHFADTIGSSLGAITAVLILSGLLCRKKGPKVEAAAVGVWIGQVLYEFIQPIVKTGIFDWYDVVAAAVGGGVGVLIVKSVVRKFSNNGGEPVATAQRL